MVQHHLGVHVGSVVRPHIHLREAIFVLGLPGEGTHEDRLQGGPEVLREVLLISRRPEVVDDVVAFFGDLYLEGLVLTDLPLELDGTKRRAR